MSGIMSSFIATLKSAAAGIFTWTSRSLPSSVFTAKVIYGGSKFVALCGNSALVSSNGITWSGPYTIPTPSGSGNWKGFAFGNGIFCVTTANSGNNYATSTDGQTWTMGTTPGANAFWSAIAYDGTVFCAVDINSFDTITSTDGATWTRRANNTIQPSSIASNGTGQFVCTGQFGSASYSSDHGVTWTSSSLPASNAYDVVSYGGGTYFAFGGPNGGASTYAASSTNGTSWSAKTMPTTTTWLATAWNGNVWCAIGGYGSSSNIVYTSPDLVSWTARSFTASNYWNTLAYGAGLFVAMIGLFTSANYCNTSPMN